MYTRVTPVVGGGTSPNFTPDDVLRDERPRVGIFLRKQADIFSPHLYYIVLFLAQQSSAGQDLPAELTGVIMVSAMLITTVDNLCFQDLLIDECVNVWQ